MIRGELQLAEEELAEAIQSRSSVNAYYAVDEVRPHMPVADAVLKDWWKHAMRIWGSRDWRMQGEGVHRIATWSTRGYRL